MNNREAMQKAFESCERYAGRDFTKTNGVYTNDGVQHEFRHFLEGYQAGLASQAQQERQWISVEERLPETYIEDDRKLIALGKPIGASIKSDDVLVLLKTGNVKMDRLAGIVGNEPFWWIYRNLVVSWMPLPPAPEGGE